MRESAASHFENLLSRNAARPATPLFPFQFSNISGDVRFNFCSTSSKEEVKDVVFSIDKDSVGGPDGFSSASTMHVGTLSNAEHGLPLRFLNLIKHAAQNCWFSVLVNGEAAGFLKSSQGLRQGDPISSALFIIAVETFSRGMDFLFNAHPDMYYQAKCDVKCSHLSYADDVIIFTKCKETGVTRLMHFLRQYEEMSGQKINYDKIGFIPRKKANNIAHRIKSITGFVMKALPITYLGAHLHKGHKRKSLFERLIGKVGAKVSGWEHCHLSYGGHLQIIKSVLSSMPIYLLQS
ncbi:UNVERIFIED_CONTAM: hypothetical protein Sradi_3840300 [Sesamum radiatum]|uniref:Reverse transcriptase domain-containing protein n=1 Tax=Sesamum radiatum TaxID=300843 RepID=A0AAW2Q1C1_SESRA